MKQIKKIIKRGMITSIIIFIYGLFLRNSVVYTGMFVGSLVSVLTFYMLYVDATNIVLTSKLKKQVFINYGKRYFLWLLTFIAMGYFGKLEYIVATAVGMFNIRFNIFLFVIQDKITKNRKN